MSVGAAEIPVTIHSFPPRGRYGGKIALENWREPVLKFTGGNFCPFMRLA
jgi:hypothetical protein